MRPLDLEEFAADLYRNGNEFGKEILELVDLESEVAGPYLEICEELQYATKSTDISNDLKRVEWLSDRSQLLDEIADMLDKAGYQGDIDDALQNVLADLTRAQEDLEIAEADLESLKNPPMVYDL